MLFSSRTADRGFAWLLAAGDGLLASWPEEPRAKNQELRAKSQQPRASYAVQTRQRAVALLLLAILLAAGGLRTAAAQSGVTARLKDIVVLKGAAPRQLVGYGLVVGLDRTGDRARGRRRAPYTVQSIANMLRRYGIRVNPEYLGSRNAAAVMVTTTMPPFSGPGSRLDVTVAALGDARSLSGGVLLQTPLLDPLTQKVFAIAQGPLATGGAGGFSQGASVRVNHTNTGRIPNGAIVKAGLPVELNQDQIGLILERPDFTNAVKVAEAVNGIFAGAAQPVHAGLVRVDVPASVNGIPGLMAEIQGLTITVDTPARVVINERTGIIVAGGNVGISEVMVTYGSLVISTQEQPFVAQPPPFSEGQTVAGAVGEVTLEQDVARSVVLPPNTNVTELAAALNELGLTARDVIAIFQSIDRAGALQGQLVIL